MKKEEKTEGQSVKTEMAALKEIKRLINGRQLFKTVRLCRLSEISSSAGKKSAAASNERAGSRVRMECEVHRCQRQKGKKL